MAHPFDEMLEHREVVVYRAPRTWIPNTVALTFFAYAASVAIAAGTGMLRFDAIGLASLAAALAGVTAFTLFYYVRGWSLEAVVTDQRLLHRSGWRNPVTTELRIRDICRVQVSWDHLRLTRRDGRSLGLGHAQCARGLGVAVAHAALLPLPRETPGREAFADTLWQVCGMTIGILAAVVPLRYYYPDFAAAAESYGWWVSGSGYLLAGWILHTLGLVFGGNLAIVLLRPVFSYDEMRAWIENSEISWPPTGGPPTADCRDDWCWSLMNLLYGRRPAAPTEES